MRGPAEPFEGLQPPAEIRGAWGFGPRRVLVSGAGVAGLTLAYWLSRFGFVPTVVERRESLRFDAAGHAVDLFGPALTVLGWMGFGPAVDSVRTGADTVSFIRPGHRPVDIPERLLTEGLAADHVELMRGDLVRLLHDAGRNEVEQVFDDSVTSLADDGAEVEVSFRRSRPRTFDLVVGADGLHSTTRALAFGGDPLHFLGAHLAVFGAPNRTRLTSRSVVFADAGRVVEVYATPGTDRLRVLLLFRSDGELVPDAADHTDHHRHGDRAAQEQLVRHAYAGAGWEVPQLLRDMADSDDFYLDSVSQVHLPRWRAGRVALVGDAGYATGPAVGGGTSLAVLGAYSLATALAEADGADAGLAAYQRALEPAVAAGMSIAPRALATLVPRSSAQVWAMAQAVRLLPRLPGPLRRRVTSFGGGPAAMLRDVHLSDPGPLTRGRLSSERHEETRTDE